MLGIYNLTLKVLCHIFFPRAAEINSASDDGTTVLHHAASKDLLSICKLILDKTVDKNPRNDMNTTPLHEAARAGSILLVKIIMMESGEF